MELLVQGQALVQVLATINVVWSIVDGIVGVVSELVLRFVEADLKVDLGQLQFQLVVVVLLVQARAVIQDRVTLNVVQLTVDGIVGVVLELALRFVVAGLKVDLEQLRSRLSVEVPRVLDQAVTQDLVIHNVVQSIVDGTAGVVLELVLKFVVADRKVDPEQWQ